MKIMILVQKMYETGVARAASKLSRDLSEAEYKKTILSYEVSNKDYRFNGEVVNMETPHPKSFFQKIIFNIKRYKKIKRFKQEKKIDASVSFQLSASVLNILTKKNDKVIMSIRSFLLKDEKGFTKYLYKWIIKNIYKRADIIVPVSLEIRNDLVKNYNIPATKIQVIYNYYDVQEIQNLSLEEISEEEQLLMNNPTIITSGRLVDQKGHWHLIRSFVEIKKEIPNACLIILGEGYLFEYLNELVKQFELENDVFFLGYQENPFKYIARADIYVLPSLHEGFPNALCEAMACGKPVVSTDCPSGPREILFQNPDINMTLPEQITRADYGILTPQLEGVKFDAKEPISKSEKYLSRAIVDLYKNKEELSRYTELALQRVQHFNKEETIKQWEEVIRK